MQLPRRALQRQQDVLSPCLCGVSGSVLALLRGMEMEQDRGLCSRAGAASPCVPVSPCPCVPAPWTLSPRHPQRVPGADGGMPASPLAVRGEAQPSSPTFPAQVRPPGADPAGSTELPGSRGLLPGVARCHRAAAGPALACQRLRQPRAGSPPANPGQGGHGHGGTGHRGSHKFGHGEGWDGESSRCHRSLPPRPSARRSAPGWRSWKESWRAGSGSCRW